MNGKAKFQSLSAALLASAAALVLTSCQQEPPNPVQRPEPTVTFKPQEMADALHAVIAADREAYARHVVQHLADQKIAVSAENWKENKALPLPAHMMRLASESVQQKGAEFHYVLRSLSPINPKNGPQTPTEKDGLQQIAEHHDTNFYHEESLGGRRYFTAVYADKAVVPACVECHNQHQSSPKKDFKLGDVMGGIVVRVPLEF